MPTRKQRRRREKDFRHDVRVFEVDEEGNEIPIAELRARDEKQRKAATPARKAQTKGARGRGTIREVPPPSWDRAFKRGGLFGGVAFVVFTFLLHNVLFGLIYGIVFVPFTYFADRTAYRAYLRRLDRDAKKR